VNQKWWSILFGLVMLGCAALFAVAPAMGWWLPAGYSSHAGDIDNLFYWILWVTGFFFILTEALLVVFMYLYGQREPGEVRAPSVFWPIYKPFARLFDTATKIELTWTFVPAVILVAIAFTQVNTWAEVKYKSRLDRALIKDAEVPVQLDLSARQFEWRMRYPSPATWKSWKGDSTLFDRWVRNPEFDDVHVTNELHGILGRHVVVQLSTKDVIHSFNIPYMRVKQDALPGKIIPVWFKPTASNVIRFNKDGKVAVAGEKVVRWEYGGGMDPETGTWRQRDMVWEIACAELCGWGHYRMIGRVYIHESEEDFVAWLADAAARQHDFGQQNVKK
jgi:cytochrome c oxidase subunit II